MRLAQPSPDQSEAQYDARGSAQDERVRSPPALQPSATDEVQRSGQGVERPAEKVEPLVPALTKHSRTIEDVAR